MHLKWGLKILEDIFYMKNNIRNIFIIVNSVLGLFIEGS